MIRVLLVDDHRVVRQGLRAILNEVPGIEVVGEVAAGENAIKFVREQAVDVVLLDVIMPGISGLETAQRMLTTNPNLKVVALTMVSHEPYPYRMMHSGARGYLTKECSAEELISVVKKVYSGDTYIAPHIAQKLAMKSIQNTVNDEVPIKQLSERELEVMRMIANGMKVQEVSDKLCLSSKTINSYRYRIFAKLKIKNDVELTLLAVRLKMLDNIIVT